MPLLIKDEDVRWSETISKIRISVRVPAKNTKNVSLLTSDTFLQVSCPPHIWECVLYDEVDSDNSVARIAAEVVSFELLKKEEKLWGALKHVQSDNKDFCREHRQKAREETERKLKEKTEVTLKSKTESNRKAVRTQIRIDDFERKRIEERKQEVRDKMTQEITTWKNEIVEKKDDPIQFDVMYEDIPPPRRSGNITVNFTERYFPTAARESQVKEEVKWLETQSTTMKKIEDDLSGLPPEQRNPVWLKNKGEKFCKNGDYLSAVNAYSLALKMCPSYYSLHLERAQCHLKLNNLHKALEDSSRALELLESLNPHDYSCRARSHICRARAFVRLELYAEGLVELEAALHLDSTNEVLKEEIRELRDILEGRNNTQKQV